MSLRIPMPGHPVGPAEQEQVAEDCSLLARLVGEADAVFLLTDTRESRWLPTLLCAAMDKVGTPRPTLKGKNRRTKAWYGQLMGEWQGENGAGLGVPLSDLPLPFSPGCAILPWLCHSLVVPCGVGAMLGMCPLFGCQAHELSVPCSGARRLPSTRPWASTATSS